MNTKQATLREVAAVAGVGLATASRALGEDTHCALQTRKRVRLAAKRLGYLPDPGVAALARRRITGIRNLYPLVWLKEQTGRLGTWHHGLFRLLKTQAEKRGYTLTVERLSALGGPAVAGRVLSARGVTGCFVPSLSNAVVVEQFDWEKFSVVSFLQENYVLPFDTVRPDLFAMMFEALQRARAGGTKSIGVVIPSSTIARENELLISACAYHQRELPDSPPTLILQPDAQGKSGHYAERTREWFARHRPEVVIGKTEGAYWALRDAGWKSPADYRFMTLRRDTKGREGFDWQLDLLAEALMTRMHTLVGMGVRGRRETPGTWMIAGRWCAGK